ncbi:MAG: AAA family ATPase [Coleofasciculus sp. C1-SOL-03]|jgi:predicted ATP-dependent endonuclease of OLD family|uniref:AAA family ATPase n=1 Tax=Coleofasciculus sp. C1-SOL-03 TaxID=3069522 RepID=UPI0032F3FB2A
MYINEIEIINIRSIKNLSWEISLEQCAGWHVVIGDNGSGKSSLLRSVALALVGPTEAVALRQNWNDWLTQEQKKGTIRLDLSYDSDFDKFSGQGRRMVNYLLPVRLLMLIFILPGNDESGFGFENIFPIFNLLSQPIVP